MSRNAGIDLLRGVSILLVIVHHVALRIPRFGRLSCECYLTHMFVVFAVVRVWRAADSDLRHGYLWYRPAVALSWALGAAVSRWFSVPAERGFRARLAPAGRSSAP